MSEVGLVPGATRRIRVLVVGDSADERGALLALLDSDPELEVAGWADDGESAIRAAGRLRPDVITMALSMESMDGLEVTRRIMRMTPTPIVLVSPRQPTGERGSLEQALSAGALAIEAVPSTAAGARALLESVKGMSRVRVLRRTHPDRQWPVTAPSTTRTPDIVAIGASTGGPQALYEILTRLPAGSRLPILIVQHMSEGFANSLIAWLQPHCALPIQLARPGAPLDRPGIHVAPTGQHLVVINRTVCLTLESPVGGHRPSATRLFQSVAREYGAASIGVLLTGMGEDGAAGLAELKKAGGTTIAQDEASSIVFGMPAAAVRLGVVDHVLSPPQIGRILEVLGRHGRHN